jgi:acyl-CoA synthetase (AMP-forming)/AMP-acid ligase II
MILPPDLLDRTILRHWHKGARRELSGREFWGEVSRLAGWIETRTRPGDIVLVIGHTAPGMMAMFLAVAASGRLGAYFPPHSPIQDERHYYEQQRHALAAIDPAAICAMEPAVAATVRRIDADLGARVLEVPQGAPGEDIGALEGFRARLASDAPLFVQHSSGTTGIKKAVAISGTMLAGQFGSYWPTIRAAAGAQRLKVATWLPLYHDMGLVASFLMPVLGGDAISTLDPFEWIADPGAFLRMIEADGCDVTWMPNFAFRHFVRLRRTLHPARLDSVKLWVDCSEPCRWADARGFEAAFAGWGVRPRSVVGCYAMAETVFAVSQCVPAERRGLSVPPAVPPGTPIGDTGAHALGDDAPEPTPGHKAVLSSGRVLQGLDVATWHEGQRLPAGTYGEIGIGGDFLFPAYRGRNAAESNIDRGVFHTGDLGAIVDGHVYVFGRLKEIIIVNGKNIFAGDVEAVLGAVHGLRRGRIVAFGVDSDMTVSEELIVVAEHDEAAGVAEAALRATVSRSISETFLVKPRDVRIVAERWLVKSTSGKISRDENRRRYLAQFRGTTP